jgi:hypothetical protein
MFHEAAIATRLTMPMTMFYAQITVALFAAFLLGMIAGSGMEFIVRGWGR